jgi:site-specific DNA-methyltransferase (adenine-specific)
MYKLYNGDCLEVMDRLIEEGVKVDAIICDPPYGTTACKWDTVIPFDEMWERLNKLIKPNGAIVLFGSEPFSSALRMSNIKNYKYDWIWKKTRMLGFTHCKNKPMNKYENISVFSKAKVKHRGQNNRMEYNPQGLIPYNKMVKGSKDCEADKKGHRLHRPSNKSEYIQEFTNYPHNILEFNSVGNTVHPTQKSVELMEYLIKTYTNENELVLDFAMGSGSTGVACMNTNRQFIGIELDKNYFEIAEKRIKEADKNA